MTRPPKDLSALYLKPGQWFSTQDAGLVKTILGSCVAVTMFHIKTGRAAICHAVMPVCPKKRVCSSYCENTSKYVDCIVGHMAETFFREGIQFRDIEVKLFGGSDTLGLHGKRRDSLGVGNRNVEQALESIKKMELRLRSSDVGGKSGRKLFFNTQTGEAMVKRLTGTGVYRLADFE